MQENQECQNMKKKCAPESYCWREKLDWKLNYTDGQKQMSEMTFA